MGIIEINKKKRFNKIHILFSSVFPEFFPPIVAQFTDILIGFD